MKETTFIDQRKKRWEQLEQLQRHGDSSAEEMSDRFAEISDDLSYAQTFYHKRTIRVYLNQLARSVHQQIYTQRKDKLSKFIDVWKVSLPVAIYNGRKELRLAFILSLLWITIGAISTLINPDFPRLILGNQYVEQTLQNIQEGNPLGIYTSSAQTEMFFNITLNNIRVAFFTFIFGVLFTFGTHILLFNNTIMLGAFQCFFAVKGLFITSFLGIWIHGAFEISAIVIAAGAGFTLGNGLLFPGSYTRLQSFTIGAKHGLKIMLSLVPFFIAAGFLESYVTHNYDVLNTFSKVIIIALSFSLILFYYVFYPRYVIRKNPTLEHVIPEKIKPKIKEYDPYALRSFAQLFSDTFSTYPLIIGRTLKTMRRVLLLPMLLLTAFQLYQHFDRLPYHYYIDWKSLLGLATGASLINGMDGIVLLLWSIIIAQALRICTWHILHSEQSVSYSWKTRFFESWLATLPLFLCLTLVPYEYLTFCLFLLPFAVYLIPSLETKSRSYSTAVKDALQFSKKEYGNLLIGLICLLFIFALFAQTIAFYGSMTNDAAYYSEPAFSDFLDYLVKFIHLILEPFTKHYLILSNSVRIGIYFLFIVLILPLFSIFFTFSFTSIREKFQSEQLRRQLYTHFFKSTSEE